VALAGAIALAVAIRSDGSSSGASQAAGAPDRSASSPAPASTITVVPIVEPAAGASTETSTDVMPGAATATGATAGTVIDPLDLRVRGTGAQTGRPLPGAAMATPIGVVASAPTPVQGAKASSPSTPRRGAAPVSAESRTDSSIAPQRARRAAHDDDRVRAFADESYDQVVAPCSAGPVSAERAPVCLAVACRIGDAARARKLITAVPAASREQLIASCRQSGVEVSAPTKPTPPTKPVDCEADPMACQR
jgi:hypothetical protein